VEHLPEQNYSESINHAGSTSVGRRINAKVSFSAAPFLLERIQLLTYIFGQIILSNVLHLRCMASDEARSAGILKKIR
jgi:hypothetical protein